MEARAGIAIALLLVGCSQPQIENKDAEPIVAVASPVVSRLPQGRHPRRFKLRLTLDRPEDLRVKVNDLVVKGQVVSQRSVVRARLMQERKHLHRQLNQHRYRSAHPSYAVEQAEVEQARLKVKRAKEAIAHFDTDSPWTDYARQILPLADSAQLGTLEAEFQEAKGELAIAVAKRQKAQQQRSEIVAQRSKWLSQVRTIEEQLNSIGVVRSPYSGVVKAIKWLGQIDQEIQVELTLVFRENTHP